MATPQNNLPTSLQTVLDGPRLIDGKAIADTIAGRTGINSQDAVTASTTQTQAGGTKIVSAITNIGTATNSDAVTFPKANAGSAFTLVNSSGQTIQAFPAVGDTINAAAKNAAVTIATATTSSYVCTLAGQWWGGAVTNEA